MDFKAPWQAVILLLSRSLIKHFHESQSPQQSLITFVLLTFQLV